MNYSQTNKNERRKIWETEHTHQSNEEKEEDYEIEDETNDNFSTKSNTKQIFVGIGCQLGRHRSVAIVEKIGQDLKKVFPECNIFLQHRDIDRKGSEKQEKQKRDQIRNSKKNFLSD